MSRDFTAYEQLCVEREQVKQGLPNMWQFMEKLQFSTDGGKTYAPYIDAEEIELRKKYGEFGKLYEPFVLLYKEIMQYGNGEAVLRKAQKDLEDFIEKGEGDKDSVILKWFFGELDPNFYYAEHNNELLRAYLVESARSVKLNNELA